MSDLRSNGSHVAGNRLAVATVVASLVVAAIVALGVWIGGADAIAPERGLGLDALPLYFLVAAVAVALTVWSWGRVLSWLE